jgi:elongation factor G
MRTLTFTDESQGKDIVTSGIPPEVAVVAEKARHELVEAVAELDEQVLEAYMENADVSAEVLREGIRRLCLANKLVPVLCGSALKKRGIQPVLDAVVDFLPSPLDIPPARGHQPGRTETVERDPDDMGPLSSLAFKVATDPYVGRLVFVRVYSGRLKKGQNVYNPRLRKRERITRLVRLHADDREEIECLYSGEIGAVVGLKSVTTGDTLCAENAPVELERIRFPDPVMFIAIEPKSRADKEKLQDSLQSLMDEDPTCRVRADAETGQTILSGMGELHLEILVDRLAREFRVTANTGKPMVAYHETVTAIGGAEHTFDRDIGERRHFARVAMEVTPADRGKGNVVEFAPKASDLPTEMRTAVEQGVQDGIWTGVLGRYAMRDVKVRVTEAVYQEELASDIAFRTAAVMAFRAAAAAAGPELLEPIMSVEIVTPEEYTGELLNDLNSRRGKIREMQNRASTQVVRALAPLAELFGYTTAIRSLSRGRASYTMEPQGFELVPAGIRDTLLNR